MSFHHSQRYKNLIMSLKLLGWSILMHIRTRKSIISFPYARVDDEENKGVRTLSLKEKPPPSIIIKFHHSELPGAVRFYIND
jgi:hypothetical protein